MSLNAMRQSIDFQYTTLLLSKASTTILALATWEDKAPVLSLPKKS